MSILSSAADVLRCFSASRRDVTVTDLVSLLGMPKSNASRLLRAMRDEGILETVGDSKRYRPSLLLNQIGGLYRYAASLIERSDAAVRRISDECGHAGYVSVRRGADIVGVTVHPGRHALRVVTAIGEHIPAFASSTGRALLARLPDDQIRALYPTGFTAPSETAPRNMAELLKRIALVRKTGFAESHYEAVRGVHAISVAIGDPSTGDEAALCISYPTAIVAEDERRAIICSLSESAAEIAALTQDPHFFPLNLSIAEKAL